jgi:hypothetical protein
VKDENVEVNSVISARKLLIFKTTNANISRLFTVFYTVIRHARDWRKTSRNPGYLTLDTARKLGDLVIARDQVIKEPIFEARRNRGSGEDQSDRSP